VTETLRTQLWPCRSKTPSGTPNARKIVNRGIATPAYNNTVLMSYANTLFGI